MSNSLTRKTVRPQVKIILAVLGFLTVLTPGVVGLFKSFDGTAEKAEKKVDLSYELLKQKVEFTDKELSSLRDDVRMIRQILMGCFSSGSGNMRNTFSSFEDENKSFGVGLLTPPEVLFEENNSGSVVTGIGKGEDILGVISDDKDIGDKEKLDLFKGVFPKSVAKTVKKKVSDIFTLHPPQQIDSQRPQLPEKLEL